MTAFRVLTTLLFCTLLPAAEPPSPGSVYSPQGRLADLARDLRASQVGDLVTIVIAEKASAASRGTTNSNRKSAASNSISALAGPTRAAGPWANLATLGGDIKLQGQGETSREAEMTTTLTARVVSVEPNGNLVLEGSKDIVVNSERQKVALKGIARWNDLSNANRIRSDRLASLEVKIDGKGVVQDAIKRPFFLYRLLLGLLPF
jgi:flagellar L-ring protein FlgH